MLQSIEEVLTLSDESSINEKLSAENWVLLSVQEGKPLKMTLGRLSEGWLNHLETLDASGHRIRKSSPNDKN